MDESRSPSAVKGARAKLGYGGLRSTRIATVHVDPPRRRHPSLHASGELSRMPSGTRWQACSQARARRRRRLVRWARYCFTQATARRAAHGELDHPCALPRTSRSECLPEKSGVRHVSAQALLDGRVLVRSQLPVVGVDHHVPVHHRARVRDFDSEALHEVIAQSGRLSVALSELDEDGHV